MAKPLYRVGMEALQAFLQTELGEDVTVNTGWPDHDKESSVLEVSIVRTGSLQVEEYIFDNFPGENRIVEGSESGDPIREYRWDLDCQSQGLQVDLWARSEVALEDLEARIDPILRKGTAATLGTLGGQFRDGPLLGVGAVNDDGSFPGYADFTLENGPAPEHTGDQHQRHDWRSTYRVTMRQRYSIWAVTSYQAQIILRQKTGTNPETVEPEDSIIESNA